MTLSLKDTLTKLYSPSAGITTYDGEASAPFDTTKMFEFTSQYTVGNITASADSYWEENTHDGKWIYNKLSGLVVKIPGGEDQATFTDADFKISGCNNIIYDPKEKLSIFF